MTDDFHKAEHSLMYKTIWISVVIFAKYTDDKFHLMANDHLLSE